MNDYTVHFRYAREHISATDSASAIIAAKEIIAQDMSIEDRGKLVAVERHEKDGSSTFFYIDETPEAEASNKAVVSNTLPRRVKRPQMQAKNMKMGAVYPLSWGAPEARPKPVPAIGSRVQVTMNSMGKGTVRGYFAESGYLGVIVDLEDPPVWFIRQNGKDEPAYLFAPEIRQI